MRDRSSPSRLPTPDIDEDDRVSGEHRWSRNEMWTAAGELGVDVERALTHEEGWDFIVLTDGTTAVRFPRGATQSDQLQVEARLLSQFAPISFLPVPLPVLIERGGKVCSRYPFLPGTSLAPAAVSTWPDERLQGAGRRLGAVLSALHTFPMERAKRLGVPQPGTRSVWVTKLDELREIVYPFFGAIERDWTESLYATFLSVLDAQPPPQYVTHSDLGPDHLLRDESSQSLVGLIDFGAGAIDFSSMSRAPRSGRYATGSSVATRRS